MFLVRGRHATKCLALIEELVRRIHKYLSMVFFVSRVHSAITRGLKVKPHSLHEMAIEEQRIKSLMHSHFSNDTTKFTYTLSYQINIHFLYIFTFRGEFSQVLIANLLLHLRFLLAKPLNDLPTKKITKSQAIGGQYMRVESGRASTYIPSLVIIL